MSMNDEEKNIINELMRTVGMSEGVEMLSADCLDKIGDALHKAMEDGVNARQQLGIDPDQAFSLIMASLAVYLQGSGIIKDEYVLKPNTN